MNRPPRNPVQDLKVAVAVQPQATPQDVYIRPGVSDIGAPPKTNPMTQLGQALGTTAKALDPIVSQFAMEEGEAAAAQNIADFNKNKEQWKTAVRNGTVPLGANPHAARAVHRLMLNELSDDFTSSVNLAFNGEAGAQARASNDPQVMRKFLDDQAADFYQANMRNGDKEIYNGLDINEVWLKNIDRTNGQLMNAHSRFRVQETERELMDVAGASMSKAIDGELAGVTASTPYEERAARLKAAATRMTDAVYNPDRGLIQAGVNPKAAGDLMVDTVIARANASGDRSVLEVLDFINRPGGPRVMDVPAFQQKRLAAEEHLTVQGIREEQHRWSQEDRPHAVASKEHQEKEWAKNDQRWEQEQARWREHAGNVAEKEVETSLTRRLYEGLRHPDSKRATKMIDAVMREAERVLPASAERLHTIVNAHFTRNSAKVDDDIAVATVRAQMSKDPMSVDHHKLAKMVIAGQMKSATMMSLSDDLDRLRVNAEHPFMRQPEIRELLDDIQSGVRLSVEDEFSAQGILRKANASADFRDRAQAWIDTHPKGSMAEFRVYMREQTSPILERHQDEYRKLKDSERAKAAEAEEKAKAAEAAKVSRSNAVAPSVEDLARQQAETAQRQRELDRLKAYQSAPRVNEGAAMKWLRGEREKVEDPQQPRMGERGGWLDWALGYKKPEEKPAPKQIKASEFGSFLTQEQRTLIERTTDRQQRITHLRDFLMPEFMKRGLSVEDLIRELHAFEATNVK